MVFIFLGRRGGCRENFLDLSAVPSRCVLAAENGRRFGQVVVRQGFSTDGRFERSALQEAAEQAR